MNQENRPTKSLRASIIAKELKWGPVMLIILSLSAWLYIPFTARDLSSIVSRGGHIAPEDAMACPGNLAHNAREVLNIDNGYFDIQSESLCLISNGDRQYKTITLLYYNEIGDLSYVAISDNAFLDRSSQTLEMTGNAGFCPTVSNDTCTATIDAETGIISMIDGAPHGDFSGQVVSRLRVRTHNQ